MVNDTELAYMCGVFDGEGCVSFVRVRPKHRGLIIRASVYNSDRGLIAPFKEAFGGHVGNDGDRRSKNKTVWHWWCHTDGLMLFSQSMLRFCKERSKRAKLQIVVRYLPQIRGGVGQRSISVEMLAARDAAMAEFLSV